MPTACTPFVLSDRITRISAGLNRPPSDEWKRIPCTASAAPAMMAAAADVPSKPPYDVLGAAGSTRLVSALPSAHAQQSIRLPKLPYAFRVDPHSDAARQSLEPAPTTMAPESLKS